jgi:hypothetical protein
MANLKYEIVFINRNKINNQDKIRCQAIVSCFYFNINNKSRRGERRKAALVECGAGKARRRRAPVPLKTSKAPIPASAYEACQKIPQPLILKNSVGIAAKRHNRRKNKKPYEKSCQKFIHLSGGLKYFCICISLRILRLFAAINC